MIMLEAASEGGQSLAGKADQISGTAESGLSPVSPCVQSKLGQLNTQYMEIKRNALLLKIRLEGLKIVSETYTPEIVNVHWVIRDKLQGGLSQEE
ncbi:HAUS augmin-like complex subunit 4, partial [Ophiophagus hannah]